MKIDFQTILIVLTISFVTFSVGIISQPSGAVESAQSPPSIEVRCIRGKSCPCSASRSYEELKPSPSTVRNEGFPLLSLTDNSDTGQSAYTSQSTEQLIADKCAQICDCAPNSPMPNGWDGYSSSVGWWKGCSPYTLLHWTIPDLPEGDQITEAKIELYCPSSWGQVQGQLAFAPVTASWDPNTVTWNTQPGVDLSKEIATGWPSVGQFLQLDITSIVRLWCEGTLPNNGIEAYAKTTYYHGGVDFASPGYGNASYRPKLTITVTPAYDFTHDGKVNFEDLEQLSAYWLTNEPSIDIAPEEPDGIINFLDFAVFAQHWWEGM